MAGSENRTHDHEATGGDFEAYWAECAHRIGPFVRHHYRWPGVFTLHRAAWGWDLLRAPFNVLMAVPAFLLQCTGLVLRTCGAGRPAHRLLSAPLGVQTAVERTLITTLQRELLAAERLDQVPRSRGATGVHLDATEFEAAAATLITRYAENRRAAADVTTALIAGLVGLLAFDRFTPGALSAGQELATSVSHYAAVNSFFLGETLGGLYYRLFPPSADPATLIAAVLAVTVAMSVLAAFAGLIADPIQARLGLHHRRLRRWLGTCRQLAGGAQQPRYQPWDPYMARLADVLDAVRGVV